VSTNVVRPLTGTLKPRPLGIDLADARIAGPGLACSTFTVSCASAPSTLPDSASTIRIGAQRFSTTKLPRVIVVAGKAAGAQLGLRVTGREAGGEPADAELHERVRLEHAVVAGRRDEFPFRRPEPRALTIVQPEPRLDHDLEVRRAGWEWSTASWTGRFLGAREGRVSLGR